ncbi:uncharacterized protein LOC108657978 [Drosophila navojoa]|uniref:uncharacterized protein LOC108657978 n=1 Tax=Drosophila navojoa TaxID=7232 RepID=UPI0008474553|nr:uncharacterized protein LOC108657978 [Drosophila navojoa]
MYNNLTENEMAKLAEKDASVKDLAVASIGDPIALCLQETQQKLSTIKVTQDADERPGKELEQLEGEIVKPIPDEIDKLTKDDHFKVMEWTEKLTPNEYRMS